MASLLALAAVLALAWWWSRRIVRKLNHPAGRYRWWQ